MMVAFESTRPALDELTCDIMPAICGHARANIRAIPESIVTLLCFENPRPTNKSY
jgi:hypothetical protein